MVLAAIGYHMIVHSCFDSSSPSLIRNYMVPVSGVLFEIGVLR
jgi:hypothetical protein